MAQNTAGAAPGAPLPRDGSALAREARTVDLRAAGLSFDQIAEQVGYSDRGGAHKAFMRAMTRMLAPGVNQIRDLEEYRLDTLTRSVWPQALKGDLQAVGEARRLSESRRRLWGVDHADALAEQRLRLDERLADLLILGLAELLAELGLADDPRAKVAVGSMLQKLHVQQLALDAGHPDDEIVDAEIVDDPKPRPRKPPAKKATAAPRKRTPRSTITTGGGTHP